MTRKCDRSKCDGLAPLHSIESHHPVSRFADPNATDRLVLGPCACPGTPHGEDWMELRTQLGAEDLVQMERGGVASLEVLVVRWNLLDNDGSAAALDRDHFARLYLDVYPLLNEWTKQHVRTSTVPNASAAPSRASTRASGSRTPTPTTGDSSTT